MKLTDFCLVGLTRLLRCDFSCLKITTVLGPYLTSSLTDERDDWSTSLRQNSPCRRLNSAVGWRMENVTTISTDVCSDILCEFATNENSQHTYVRVYAYRYVCVLPRPFPYLVNWFHIEGSSWRMYDKIHKWIRLRTYQSDVPVTDSHGRVIFFGFSDLCLPDRHSIKDELRVHDFVRYHFDHWPRLRNIFCWYMVYF